MLNLLNLAFSRLTFVVSIMIFFLGRRRRIIFYLFFLIKTKNWSFGFKIQVFFNHLLLLRVFFVFSSSTRHTEVEEGHIFLVCDRLVKAIVAILHPKDTKAHFNGLRRDDSM